MDTPRATTNDSKSATPRKTKSSSAELMKAKRCLDLALPHLQGFQQFKDDTIALRNRILDAFIEHERQAGAK